MGNSPADPVGWPASFPRFRVGEAPGLAATKTERNRTRSYLNG